MAVNNLSKGMHSDFSPQNQPKGTWRYALNMLEDNGTGIINEYGQAFVAELTDQNPLGYWLFDDGNFVVISTPAVGADALEVGIFDGVRYTTKLREVNCNISFDKAIRVTGKRNHKGERIIYWTDGVNPYRYLNVDNIGTVYPSGAFDQNKLLFVNKKAKYYPQISNIVELDGGNLLSGSYQVFIQLGDSDFSYTAWAVQGNPFYLTDKSSTLAQFKKNGTPAGTQTSKAIQISLSGIDTTFRYYRIGIVKTIGGIVTCVKSPDLFVTDDTLSFTYSSDNQFETAELEEFTVQLPTIETGETLEQINRRLHIGNFTVKNREIEYQDKANDIIVQCVIKDRLDDTTENFANPTTAYFYKGFRSDEIYAIAIAWVYDDFSESMPYHIPGRVWVFADDANHPNWENNNTASSITPGVLYDMAYWQSTEEYPAGYDFPTTGHDTSYTVPTVGTTFVRHHKFPSISTYTHFSGSPISLHIKGIQLSSVALPDAAYQTGLLGYKIYFVPRDTDNNSSIYSNGCFVPASFSSYSTNPRQLLGGNLLWGNAISLWRKNDGINPLSTKALASEQTDLTYEFYSPESVLGVFNKVPEKCVIEYTLYNENCISLNTTVLGGSPNNPEDGTFKAYGAFHSARGIGNTSTSTVSRTFESFLTISGDTEQGFDDSADSNITNHPNIFKNGYGTTRLAGTLDSQLDEPARQSFTDGDITTFSNRLIWRASSNEDWIYTSLSGGDTEVNNFPSAIYLANLVTRNASQYQGILGLNYSSYTGYFVSVSDGTGTPVNPPATSDIYGGDTFVNRFTFKITSGGGEEYYGEDIANTPSDNATNDVIQIRLVTDMYVESSINVEYRHTGIDLEPPSSGTAYQYPLFTGSSNSALYNYLWGTAFSDNSTLYNTDYSISNNLKSSIFDPYDTLDLQDICGVRYSEEQITSSRIDYFTQFKLNNYTSIPRDTGAIIRLQAVDNEIYAHTVNSLWNMQVAPREINVGEQTAYLGTGSLFSLPAYRLNSLPDSFGGLQHQHSTCLSDAGYMFPDTKNTTLYLMSGNKLEAVSDYGQVFFFGDNLKSDLSTQYNALVDQYVINGVDAIGGQSGEFSYTLNYAFGETVIFNGSVYEVTLNTPTVGIEPTNTIYWTLQFVISDYYFTVDDNPISPYGTGFRITWDTFHNRFIITKHDFELMSTVYGDPDQINGIYISAIGYAHLAVDGVSTVTNYFSYEGGNWEYGVIPDPSTSILPREDSQDQRLLFKEKSFTISYYPERKHFTSYHSYRPLFMPWKDNHVYFWSTDYTALVPYIYEHNITSSHSFMNSYSPTEDNMGLFSSKISIIDTKQLQSNSSQNIFWQTESTTQNGSEDFLDTFNSIIVNNSYQISKSITIDAVKSKNTWIVNNLRDYTKTYNIATISGTGVTATVNTTSTHSLIAGDVVNISGTPVSAYNIPVTILTVTARSFTFASATSSITRKGGYITIDVPFWTVDSENNRTINTSAIDVNKDAKQLKRFNDVFLEYELTYNNTDDNILRLLYTGTLNETPSIK